MAAALTVSAPAFAQHHHGGHWGHHGGWGWSGAAIGGFAAGALLGSALAAPNYYYDDPGYYYGPTFTPIRTRAQRLIAHSAIALMTQPREPTSATMASGILARDDVAVSARGHTHVWPLPLGGVSSI
jgi:hypothetical protein